MAVTDIKLVRKKANMPDFGRNLTIVYREKNFPLTDEVGNVIHSDELGENGEPLPQYSEFIVNVAVPDVIPTGAANKQALVDDLKTQADTIAKGIAQKRANDSVDKNKINSIVRAINDDSGVVFEGTYTIPT